MVGRYLKAQLMVLLCGGLVGPIFLAVYFAFGRDEMLAWMFWVGLLVTVVDVLAALALATYGARKAAATAHLEAHGVLAVARVTGIRETGTRINEQPLVTLTMHVEGPGIAPFEVQDSVLASMGRLPMITGRTLVVLVDPATNDHQIDWNRSAMIAGLAPARFTLAEDGRTYDLSGRVEPLMQIFGILKAHQVPADGTIDVRSNPVVRDQVRAVVRRAVAEQAPPAAPVSPLAAPGSPPAAAPGYLAPPSVSTSQRLQELETLRATGAVTEAEYTAKRAQIIADL